MLNKLVYAEPTNQAAKDLLANTIEQLGYQCESPSPRNSFLGAAKELRDGFQPGAELKSAGPDVVRAMSTGLFLDFMGGWSTSSKRRAWHSRSNLNLPDNGDQFLVELSNATLPNIKDRQAKNAPI